MESFKLFDDPTPFWFFEAVGRGEINIICSSTGVCAYLKKENKLVYPGDTLMKTGDDIKHLPNKK